MAAVRDSAVYIPLLGLEDPHPVESLELGSHDAHLIFSSLHLLGQRTAALFTPPVLEAF